MENECKVEQIREFHDDCTGSILDRLFAVNGLAIVATGSLSCTRAIYNAAIHSGKQSQFFYRGISREEYAAGSYGEKLLGLINEALACENTSFVVVYASCLEILAQMDFELLFSKADNPKQIPIRLFKRGPLMARAGTTKSELAKILTEAVPAPAPIVRKQMELPPLFPDFNSAAEILQDWDTFNFLITAGGCGGCLMRSGQNYAMSSSRVNDVQIALGCDRLIENGIRSAWAAQDKALLCLLGSTTLSFTGLDCVGISERLECDGIRNVYLPSTGFVPGPCGASALFLLLAEKILQPAEKDLKRVNILGYDPMLFPGRAFLEPLFSLSESLGLHCSVWGQGGLEEAAIASGATLNFVVSASGMAAAKYMEETYAVPYLPALAVGAYETAALKDRICAALGMECHSEAPMPVSAAESQRPIAVIAEPELAFALRACLMNELGMRDVRILVHSPTRELKCFYRELYGDSVAGFADLAQLAALVRDAEILISDPVYHRCLAREELRLIPLPMPLISGRQFRNTDLDLLSLFDHVKSYL